MTQPNYDPTGTDKMREEKYGSELEITYVVYLVDSNGDEFFITQEDEQVRVNALTDQKPLVVKNLFQISAQLGRLRKKYSANCRLFALEYGEFLERKDQLSQ
ncbi:hypothetical protein [Spirosoma agri]|uniref:Uncharacterized protein n=1 Tax=Spirosoma agri TaxID=1987381 RepID=A0A6M0IQK1_9BACT|nr:hypothetical protein [Spirosoma agri]NEU70610.1 hypothetical protein [Spirosoma agri]